MVEAAKNLFGLSVLTRRDAHEGAGSRNRASATVSASAAVREFRAECRL
jgi:hypothetical protein